jgi:DNA-entry nuclease
MKNFFYKLFEIILILAIVIYCIYSEINKKNIQEPKIVSYEKSNIPDYTNESYIYIDNNEQNFNKEDMNTTSFENYSELDSLGRCGVAYANLSYELMPTEPRGNISYIKPSGWRISKYDWIEGEYLFNRCHLIAYSLAGENDNVRNLITCTRYLNATTMQDFEIKVANYIRKTRNHVLYRVTPVFEGENLIAKGVQMEAYSIEDNGEGIKFNVFAYNIEPKVRIDYLTGENSLIEEN